MKDEQVEEIKLHCDRKAQEVKDHVTSSTAGIVSSVVLWTIIIHLVCN